MELLSLPTFVNYFKVAKDDDDYLDNFIDKISVLAEQEYYVDNGIDFDHLVRELHSYGFLLGCEITEKEPESVLQAQFILQILMRLRLVEEVDLFTGDMTYKDVNDLDELRDVISDSLKKVFNKEKYHTLQTVWYVDEASK
jgi:hypothetical protein